MPVVAFQDRLDAAGITSGLLSSAHGSTFTSRSFSTGGSIAPRASGNPICGGHAHYHASRLADVAFHGVAVHQAEPPAGR